MLSGSDNMCNQTEWISSSSASPLFVCVPLCGRDFLYNTLPINHTCHQPALHWQPLPGSSHSLPNGFTCYCGNVGLFPHCWGFLLSRSFLLTLSGTIWSPQAASGRYPHSYICGHARALKETHAQHLVRQLSVSMNLQCYTPG